MLIPFVVIVTVACLIGMLAYVFSIQADWWAIRYIKKGEFILVEFTDYIGVQEVRKTLRIGDNTSLWEEVRGGAEECVGEYMHIRSRLTLYMPHEGKQYKYIWELTGLRFWPYRTCYGEPVEGVFCGKIKITRVGA